MCPRTIWLEKGGIRMDGPSERVVEAYQQASDKLTELRVVKQR